VAATILSSSGPQSVNELNYYFEANRGLVQNAMHQIVSLVCQAFPGYTPDQVYDMDYEVLMQRAALAEDKLIKTGFLNEKVIFEQQGLSQEQQEMSPPPELNSKQLFDTYEKQQGRAPAPPPPKNAPTTVISTSDMVEAEQAYTGHERSDKILRETKMVNETAGIYDDYMQQMKDGDKVVIPSHEERMRAARARAEENKKRYELSLKEKSKVDDEEWQKLLKVREEARARKAKKRR